MRRWPITGLVPVLLLVPTLWASKVEKVAKRLDKELKRVSLVAADLDGRRVVNRVMAKQLGISRKQLVEERRQTGFLYGQLFGAHEVAQAARLTFPHVAEQMKQGHSLLEISEHHEVGLKEILADAKTLNKDIAKELGRVASGEEDEQAEDARDSYDPSEDSLAADTSGFSPAEVAQAREQVHHPGSPFGASGPSGSGRGLGSEMGVGRGVGGPPAAGRGRGPH